MQVVNFFCCKVSSSLHFFSSWFLKGVKNKLYSFEITQSLTRHWRLLHFCFTIVIQVFHVQKNYAKKCERIFWKKINKIALQLMPLKMSLLSSKNDTVQRYFTITKLCLFSLAGGNLTILTTEVRSEIKKKMAGNLKSFEWLFEDNKLSIHKKYINQVHEKLNCASNEEMNIFYFRKFIDFYLIKAQYFYFLEM